MKNIWLRLLSWFKTTLEKNIFPLLNLTNMIHFSKIIALSFNGSEKYLHAWKVFIFCSINSLLLVMLYAIWYCLYILKRKKTHGKVFRIFPKSITHPWYLSCIFKLYKQYQIAQSVSINKFGRLRVFGTMTDFEIN